MKLSAAKFLTLLMITFFLSACKKESLYKFIVANNSNYHINKMRIGFYENKVTVSIEPKGLTSVVVKYRKTYRTLRDGPMLSISEINYSDSANTYSMDPEQLISIEELSKNEMNRLSLTPSVFGNFLFVKLEK